MLVHSSSVVAEAYGFGLPGYQKSFVIENYGKLMLAAPRLLCSLQATDVWAAVSGEREGGASISG